MKHLLIKGAHRFPQNRASALAWANSKLSAATDPLQRKREDESKNARQLADDWMNMRTIDEEYVNSSWEIVAFDYRSRKGV